MPDNVRYGQLPQYAHDGLTGLIEDCRQVDGSMWIEAQGGALKMTIVRPDGRVSFELSPSGELKPAAIVGKVDGRDVDILKQPPLE